MRLRRLVGVAVLAMGLAVLGACSTPTSSVGGDVGAPAPEPSDGPTPDPTSTAEVSGPPPAGAAGKACGLVTVQEASAALGVTSGLKATTDTAGECLYEAPNGKDSVAVIIMNQPYTPGMENQTMRILGEDKTKKVTGLGDAALDFNFGFQVQYHVWIKGKYLTVAVSKLSNIENPGDIETPTRTLTDKAITRL
jgi:hypothetical protein